MRFALIIESKSSEKDEPNSACYKNHSKNTTWATLAVHGSIFRRFWVPKGIPKWSKIDEQHWQKSLWSSPWISLESFWTPDCSFFRFWLDLGFIFRPSGLLSGPTLEQVFDVFSKQDSKTERHQASKTESDTGPAECAKRFESIENQ